MNSTILGNSTHVDFTECEKILRNHYNIPSERSLTFLQVELKNRDNLSLVNKIEYQVYDDNKNILDLSLCSDTKIKIAYSIKDFILSDNEIEYLKKFQKSNIDLLNMNNSFYKDICYPYSEGDSDLTLKDRVKYYSKLFNFSLCEDNCIYDNIDLENMTISCICSIKNEMNINFENNEKEKKEKKEEANVQNVILDTVKDSTYEVIKCINLVLFMNKKNNYVFWLYSILVLIHIPMIISYLIFKEEPIKIYIMKEMEKFHYIPRIKNPLKKNLKNIENKNKKIKKFKNKYNINTLIKTNINIIIKSKKKQKKKTRNLHVKDFDINSNKNINASSSWRNLATTNNISKNLLISKNKKIKKVQNKKMKNSENIAGKIKRSLIIKKIKNNILNIKHYQKSYFILNKNKKLKSLPNYYIEPTFNKLSIEKPQYLNTFPILVRKTNINEKNASKKISICSLLYNMIHIDANNNGYNKSDIKFFLFDYDYEDAITYENRKFFDIFFIILVLQEKVINTLFFHSPLELQSLRICLLLFIYSCNFSLNTLFYFSDKISDKYHYKDNNLFFFTLVNNISIILISTSISSVIVFILKKLTNSRKNIEIIFKKEEKIMKINNNYFVSKRKKKNIFITIGKILKILKIKIFIFIIIEFSLMLFFYYFTTAFCEVYKKTQKTWLIDCLSSFIISIIIEIVMAFALTVSYTVSIYLKIKSLYFVTTLLI